MIGVGWRLRLDPGCVECYQLWGWGNEFGTWWIGIVTITPLLSLRGMSHAGGYGGAYMIEN